MKKILFFSLLIIAPAIFCQVTPEDKKIIDSLKTIISNSTHDSDKVNAYFDWDNIIYISDPELDFELNKKIAKICEKNITKESNNSELIFFNRFLSSAYNNIGLGYNSYGDYTHALNYHNKALKLALTNNDSVGLSNSYNNIGNIYADMKEDEKALDYYMKSMELAKNIKTKSLSSSYTNIGNMYSNKGENEIAMNYYKKSLELDIQKNDEAGILISQSNIGDLYLKDKNYEEALNYFNKGLAIAKKINSLEGEALLQISIADVYYIQKKYKLAVDLAKVALANAKISGGLFEQQDATFLLYQNYKKLNDSKNALIMHEQFVVLKDSLESANNQRATIQQEFKHSYEKQKVFDDSEHSKQMLVAAEQEKKQKLISYFVAGGLFLVLIFSIVIFNRLRITKKQKQIIENQKQIVEEKNQEITDSIQYAKRIQNAILPPNKVVKEYLQDSFILYKPKDIVAGDFYWLEHKDNKILFAAADCTGHGVPGAMVSVICNNALNRSVREHHLTDPAKILSKTREIVVQEFEKSDEEVKDGMDIALCSLKYKVESEKLPLTQHSSPKTVATLQYAGAHNPLWIIRNNEIIETKANKQPIGQFENAQPYTTHSFELQKGDTIYIFSDGYVDQFGGEKGKKFKAKAFKGLLISIQNKTLDEQKNIIDNSFETWKGELEQIDDVCVIGVRV